MLDKIFRAGLLLLAIALPLSIGASSSLFFPLLGIWLLGAHWTWKRWPPTRGSPEKAYWVFLSVSLVSALLGNDPMHSLHEIYKKDFYIFIAVLVAALVRDRDQANRLLRAFLVAGILSAVWGLIQYVIGVDQTDRSGGTLIRIPLWLAHAPRPLLDQLSLLGGRVAGTRSHALTYAECLLLIDAYCFSFAILSPGRSVLRWLIAIWIIGGALVFSQGRGPWMATGVMMLMIAMIALRRRALWRVAAMLVPLVVFLMVPSLRVRAHSILDRKHQSNAERLHMWHAGRMLWSQSPVLGIGPGNVKTASPPYQTRAEKSRGAWGHLHNTFINFAVERGTVGLLAYLVFIAFLLRDLWTAWRSGRLNAGDEAIVAATGIGIVGYLWSGLTETTYNSVVVGMLFYFVVGLAWARIRHPDAAAET